MDFYFVDKSQACKQLLFFISRCLILSVTISTWTLSTQTHENNKLAFTVRVVLEVCATVTLPSRTKHQAGTRKLKL